MKSYEEALKEILGAVSPLGSETVELDGALGRTLVNAVHAPLDLPPFDNSSVDGYGVRAGKGPRTLNVVGEIPAGSSAAPLIDEHEAIRLFTGSPVPKGVEAVVMQEDVRPFGSKIELDTEVSRGENVRRRGEEVRVGDEVFPSGTVVTPPVLAALATLGLNRFEVARPPRVSIIGTGSELVPPGTPLGPAQVYQSNAFGVRAALHVLGIPQVTVEHVHDDAGATRQALERALAADVVITCGGVSVGDHDLVRASLAALGVEERIWRVAIRPGKPFYFGLAGDRPVFGLPGNPVSALVVFTLFVRPALLQMLGVSTAERMITVTAAHDFPEAIDRDDFVRVTLDWTAPIPLAKRLPAQGSHMLTGLAEADALLRIPANSGPLRAGGQARAIPLPWNLC